MNKLLNTLFLLSISINIQAGCSFNPNAVVNDRYYLTAGRYLYDPIHGIYYKRPNDTVRAVVYLPAIIQGSCLVDTKFFYNDSDYTNNPTIDFFKITKPGKYYCIKIPSWGCCSAGAQLIIRDSIFTISSIEEIDNQESISTLGNPFNDKITLKCSGNNEVSYDYQLLNINGLVVMNGKISPVQDIITLDAESIAPGVYFIALKGRENMTRTKILKLVKL